MGWTIGVRSSRSDSRFPTRRSNRRPRFEPGSKPNVLSMPRSGFDSRVVMPTSCTRAPSKARARCASSDFTSSWAARAMSPWRMDCRTRMGSGRCAARACLRTDTEYDQRALGPAASWKLRSEHIQDTTNELGLAPAGLFKQRPMRSTSRVERSSTLLKLASRTRSSPCASNNSRRCAVPAMNKVFCSSP